MCIHAAFICCIFLVQEAMECIFLLGHGCLSVNYYERHVSFLMHPQGIGNFISVIYELPPKLIRFSNFNMQVIASVMKSCKALSPAFVNKNKNAKHNVGFIYVL